MLGHVTAAIPYGIDATLVHVEADISTGQRSILVNGLPEHCQRESVARVSIALRKTGYDICHKQVVVNLTPSNQIKRPEHLDLPIAVAILCGYGQILEERLEKTLIVGELRLDGSLQPVRGILAISELAAAEGFTELVLPRQCAAEAGLADLPGLAIIPASNLLEVQRHLSGETPIQPFREKGKTLGLRPDDIPDLREVRGHEAVKRAMLVAAAGGHHIFLSGPNGSGKTRLARRMPGILPPMDQDESLAATKIHSLVSEEPPAQLLRRRPFRAPHCSTSAAGIAGGGSLSLPGEATLAHAGCLFLDELHDFQRDTLEHLREALREGFITTTRPRIKYPARFLLIAATIPCPCSHLGDPRHACKCAPELVERFRARLKQYLTHFDVRVEVPTPSVADLRRPATESSADFARQVTAARQIQAGRLAHQPHPVNAAMGSEEVERFCFEQLDDLARGLLSRAQERLRFTPADQGRTLRVARTIADLDASWEIRAQHIGESIQYRAVREVCKAAGRLSSNSSSTAPRSTPRA